MYNNQNMEDSINIKRMKSLESNINELFSRFETLNTFDEVHAWQADVVAVIALLESAGRRIAQTITETDRALGLLRAESSSLSVVERMFASRKVEKDLQADLDAAYQAARVNQQKIDTLYFLIDSTPGNKKEQTDLLKELRLMKKELGTEKRSLDKELRQATKTRPETLGWGDTASRAGGIGNIYEQETVRLKLKGQLAQEKTRTLIEKRLVEVEQDITWTAHFTGTKPRLSPASSPRRCATCGRDIQPAGKCPVCD